MSTQCQVLFFFFTVMFIFSPKIYILLFLGGGGGDPKQCSGVDCGGSSLFLANQARGVIQGPLQYNLEPGVFRTILAIFNASDLQ